MDNNQRETKSRLTQSKRNMFNGELLDQNIVEKYKGTFTSLNSKKRKELEASLGWLFLTDNIKKKTREKIQNQMRKNDGMALIFAVIGVLANIIASTIYITFEQVKDDITTSIIIVPNKTFLVTILRVITTISTGFLIIFLIRHYFIRLKFDKFKQKVDISATLYSTGLLWNLLLEIIVCIIHSPPFMDELKINLPTNNKENYVDIDLVLSSIIPLRVYLLFRYYSFYSSWADDRAEKICNDCNTLGGISFGIKAELKERPYTVVGVLMILSILIFGYALRNVEVAFMINKPNSKFQDWTYVWNGFWCIMITILTVGYGDFYPQTLLGRGIAIIACLWGTFLISLMVVSLTISVEFTPQEQKAYDELKKVELYSSLKKKALNMIRYGVRLRSFPENREEIKDDDQRVKYIRTLDHFKQSLSEFKKSRKFVLSKEHEVSAENILYKLNENVSEEMENLIETSNNQVSTLLDYLNLSQSIQNEIKSYVNKLDKMTQGLSDCLDDKEDE